MSRRSRNFTERLVLQSKEDHFGIFCEENEKEQLYTVLLNKDDIESMEEGETYIMAIKYLAQDLWTLKWWGPDYDWEETDLGYYCVHAIG